MRVPTARVRRHVEVPKSGVRGHVEVPTACVCRHVEVPKSGACGHVEVPTACVHGFNLLGMDDSGEQAKPLQLALLMCLQNGKQTV